MKTVCVDIDGTLVHYDGWKGHENFGKIVEGAKEAMDTLHNHGWYIIIFTTRANKESIRNFLERSGIVYDSINENPYQPENAIGGKPIADVYIDDRAITFEGNWSESVDKILHFKTWEGR